MQFLSSQVRTQNLQALANEHFDVLVIGGGITGAGVALDAVARGYTVALVEKADFASGTSSKSTKLVHGGIRYLPNFDFGLVREALVERHLLLQNAPFLVNSIGFVLPIYEGDRHPVGMPFTTPGGIGLSRMLDTGLWLYDGLAGRHNLDHHRHLNRETILEMAPTLVSQGLKEGYIYYDAQTNDARLTMAVVRTAASLGAVITNYTEVTDFISEHNQLRGAHIRDNLSGQMLTIRARHIVNATGIFAEQVEALTGTEPHIQIEPSKGIHLVLSRKTLHIGKEAIVLPETEDKRILFIVPWESRVVFGTTDTGSGSLDHPRARPADIEYLLKYLNRYLTVKVTEADIISTYAGYRPLIRPRKKNASTAKLSRTYAVLENSTGLVSIVGGKLTTYRRMAQDTVDVLSKRDGRKLVHPTEALLLQGSTGWSTAKHALQKQGATLGLATEIVEHLGHSYGSEASQILDLVTNHPTLARRLINDLPYIVAEVIYGCRAEMAMTLDDILARRTSITLVDRQRGLGIVDEVASLMAGEHKWSLAEQEEKGRAYREMIESQLAEETRLF
jgi:glycerol-3-phosphate dehydrogenase